MAHVDDRSSVPGTSFKRRSALHALWATPVVLAATATPAFAASTTKLKMIASRSTTSNKYLILTFTTSDGTSANVTLGSVRDGATPQTTYSPDPTNGGSSNTFVINTNSSYTWNSTAYAANTGTPASNANITVTYSYIGNNGETHSNGTVTGTVGATTASTGTA